MVVATPAKDTICTGDATSILLTTITNSTNGVEFNYTSTASDGTIGGNGSGTLTPGQSITDILTNSDDTQGYVAYTITPWTLDASSNQKCSGTAIEDTVWVEPTALVSVSPKNDTVCDGDNVAILLTSPTVPTREVRFRYTYEAPAGVTVTPGADSDLPPNFTITDQVDNSTDAAQLVQFIVTPYTRNATGIGEKCTGVNDTAFIWVEPTPMVVATPAKDTICTGDATSILLTTITNSTNGVEFNYTSTASDGTIGGNGSGTLTPGQSITDILTNSDDTQGYVAYTITPWTLDASSNQKCSGTAIEDTVWVDPTPMVVATPAKDTICTGDATSILLTTVTSSTNGVEFNYTSTASDGTIGGNGSGTLTPGQSITDILTNSDDTQGYVAYTITPWTLDASSNQKCSGTAIEDTVWVDPTPMVVATPAKDTICTGDATSILLTTITSSTNGVEFNYTSTASDGTIAGNGTGTLTPGQSITDILTNSDDTQGYVAYTITPWTLDASSNQKCSGTAIEDTVWVDPTPMVVATPAKDTICTGDATSILLTTVTSSTNGVEFNYTSTASDGTIGGNGSGTLTPGQSITDILTNSDDTQGYVAYTITPWTLDASSNQKCSGTAIEDTVWVEPTALVSVSPKNDTVCDGDNVAILLTSPTVPTREVRFRYTYEAPAGVTVTPGADSDLPPNFTITDQVDNSTDAAQLVQFIVTPYSRNATGNGEKCTGVNDTAFIWVEPTPMVVATPAKDTICTGDATSILLTTITNSTNGVEFNYTSTASDGTITGNGTGTLIPGQSITDILTNSDDTQGYVAYTITPWTLDASSNQKCSGTAIEDTVWVDPTPMVVATPAKDTICTGEATSILLTTITSSTNGVEFNYTSTASDGTIGGNGSGTLTPGQSITDILTNSDDTQGYVAYTITPWTLDASSNQKCSGTAIEDTVWVDPTPMVVATPAKDTICTGEATSILLTTITNSTNGVEFNYTSTASDGTIGGNGSGTLTPGQSITDILTNSDDTQGYVAYTITPWTLDASSNQKCSGTAIEDTVWVDPTPMVVATPAKDTICTGDATSILLTTVTSSTNGVEFNYTSTASDGTIGGNGSGTLTPGQSITDILTNSDDTQGYVAYTITPWTLDASSNQKCSGTPIEDTVWVEPTALVSVSPKNDTVCDGDNVAILLTSPTVPTREVRFRYTYEAPAGVTVTPGADSDLSPNFTITDQVDNSTDAAQLVQFIVTPYTRNATGIGEKCTGVNDTAFVWVEPTARVTLTPRYDTICDGDNVGITLTSPSNPTREVRFRYTVEKPAAVTVTPAGPVNNLPPSTTLTNQIDNPTDSAQLVRFIITPYTRNAGGDGEKCTGVNDTAYVWVEPTALVSVSPKNDTVCDGNNVAILLTSPTVPTREVRFRYTTETPAGVTVTPGADNALPPNYTITDQIVNTTNTSQLVSFIVTPYSRNATGEGEKCTGVNDTAFVWVEPTTRVTLTPKYDTICDGDNVGITLTSPSIPTREVRFRYTHIPVPGVTVTPGSDNNLSPNFTITDQVDNSTDAAQLVQFIVTPYTRNPGDDGEKCAGENDTAFVWVEPTARVTLTPKYDTICNGGNVGITLTSVSTPTRQVRFRYTVEKPAAVTVTPAGPVNNLSPGTMLTNQIDNPTDSAQLVRFILTPYTRNAEDDGEKCTGVNDTAYVWVEPTALVSVSPKNDTICDGDNVAILLTSPTVPTREVRFRYTYEAPAGVTVTPGADSDLPPNFTITDQVDNSTDAAQLVQFIVTPYTRNATGIGEKCTGVNDTAFVWVEPMARVTLTPKYDTICDGDNVGITLTSPSNPTREVRFRYTVEKPAAVTVTPAGPLNNLPPSTILTNQIDNPTDSAQLVRFIHHSLYPQCGR